MSSDVSNRRMSWEDAVQWLKRQPEHAALVEGCFYDDPITEAAERFYLSSEWRATRLEVANCPIGRALDLGAGRGIASYALARDGWKVTALEPDSSLLVGSGAIRSLAMSSGIELDVIGTWGEQLPMPDNSYDLVYCRAVLHHARDLKKLCAEIFRVLRPEGYFMACREHVISRRGDLKRFLAAHPLHELYGGEHAYLKQEYIHALRSAGLLLRKCINPYESDINLYPASKDGIRGKWEQRIGVPSWLMTDSVFRCYGALKREPGRLYSFVAQKPR